MLYLKNVKTFDTNQTLYPLELIIEENHITQMGADLSALVSDDAEVIDGQGGLLTPGLIDVHVHFREPGGEHKETIATGSRAAARGGFTTVCAMPNLAPVPDNADTLSSIYNTIKKDAVIDVRQYATITKNLNSETEFVDYKSLTDAGAFAFTNDGVGVQTAGTMYQAMLQAARVGKAIVAHTEDNSLLYGGVMHEGECNQALGLPGMLQLTESTQIARDVLLAEATGVHYHVCHISSKETVRVIRDAKRAGINVTCEVSPHHLLLADVDIPSADRADYKMNPPLRGSDDRQALIEGLLDGTIDMIATDHAPHATEEKAGGFMTAPFGITGIETSFQLLYTHFVREGIFTLAQLIDWMSTKPAKIFNLPLGEIRVGGLANIAIFAIDEQTTINKEAFLSKSTNSPFIGWEIYGETIATIYQGNIAYKR